MGSPRIFNSSERCPALPGSKSSGTSLRTRRAGKTRAEPNVFAIRKGGCGSAVGWQSTFAVDGWYNNVNPMPTVPELYEKLKPKLGEEEARSLLEFIESTVEQRAVTKADLQQTAASLREEMRQLEGALREEIRQVDASLREEIQKVRADLIKWSFASWVGNVAVLSGIMFALLRGAR